jgi:hypothetical protein
MDYRKDFVEISLIAKRVPTKEQGIRTVFVEKF